MSTSIKKHQWATAGLMILVTLMLGLSSPLALSKESTPEKQKAPEHSYDRLSGTQFWQAVERDRLSPTQMPGATGSAHRPSPHGPFRHDPELGTPKHAYSPFDRESIHCPSDGCEYLDGVLLVKLKPRDQGFATQRDSGGVSRPSAFDNFLDQLPVQAMERVFPNAVAPAARAMIETPKGDWIPQPDLTRWHRIILRTNASDANQRSQSADSKSSDLDLQQTLRELRTFEEVEYAEPEYLFRTIGQPDQLAAAVTSLPQFSRQSVTPATDRFNDPDINRQWHLSATNVPAAWQYLEDEGKSAGGSPDIVVAVIDTGVDYNHPDLINSMWINPAELNSTAGQDNDGNGYVDDVHGANVIGSVKSGDPMDDHGHGTHVAGIIAAQGNNNEGGVGVAPNVKIMAIKAAQYSGVLNSSDVARGIEYAIDNGADVINMSFGGYARSQLVEDALANAFGVAVLVAAAGNDGRPNLPVSACGLTAANMYPASYNWVLGVMSRNELPDPQGHYMSGFSNYDCVANDLQEYQLMAPGSGIYSTLPFGGYGAWSGTSMAAPVVAGVAALARTRWPDKSIYSSRFIMGQLAATGPMVKAYTPPRADPVSYASADALQTLTSVPQPELSYLEHWLFDTTDVDADNNPNGIVDAGETIDLAIVIRNHWGKADNVEVKLEAWAQGAIQADPYVEMLIDTVAYESVGSFNQKSNGFQTDEEGAPIGVLAPFKFRTSPDTPNDHLIVFRLTITGDNGFDPLADSVSSQSYFYQLVQSGTELPRFVETDMTLDDSRLWLVPNGVLVREGATLTIGPGARVQFFTTDPSDPFAESYQPKLQIEGILNIAGTAEAPVELFPGLLYQAYPVVLRSAADGEVAIDHAKIANPWLGWDTFYGGNSAGSNPINTISNTYFTQLVNDRIVGYNPSSRNWQGITNPRVRADTIKTSIFRELGFFFRDFKIEGRLFDEILLDGVWTNVSPSSFERIRNSVFLRNLRETRPGFFDQSRIEPQNVREKSLLRFGFREEYNGYTYVAVSGLERAIDGVSMVDRFARTLGGNLAWIESEAEQDFLFEFVQTWTQSNFNENYGNMDCGLENCWERFMNSPIIGMFRNSVTSTNQFRWVGEQTFEYENWVPDYLDNRLTRVELLKSNGLWNPVRAITASPFLIKLPGSVTEDQLNAARDQFMDERRYGSMLNNAFLNQWLDMNPDHWMRFIMESGPDYVASIAHNFWGTQSTTLIDAAIFDANDNFNLGKIHYQPILTEAPESAYPFVVDIELENSAGTTNQVGAEPVSFTVHFNRDMDTTIDPLVSFGPDTPYTDFIIPGEWSDSRTWVGDFTTTSMTGDGSQFMRVIGAVAADNPWLVTGNDYARFQFEIATSGTEAMNLQASGDEGLIRLSWSQDDFETLAGYNLYRAPVGSDTYQRVNSTTIPQGLTTWEDQTVEPGQPYRYYFTVVQTDLTESDPSNIAQATARDTIAPTLTHTPLVSAAAGLPVTIRAEASDNVAITSVTLFYKPDGESTWSERAMNLVSGQYTATLEASLIKAPGFSYYIEASDGINIARTALSASPHAVIVDDTPTVTGVSPTSGPAAGGTTIAITGSNFQAGATVTVGQAICGNVNLASSTSLQCTTGPNQPEVSDVRVRNSSGAASTLPRAFTYLSDEASISLPQSSANSGGSLLIPLSIGNVTGLVSAQLHIDYDPTVIQVSGVSNGNLSAGWVRAVNINNSTGKLIVAMSSDGGSVSGNGSLLQLSLDIIGAPSSQTALTLSEVLLNDGAIQFLVQNGQITVDGVFDITGTVSYWNEQRPVPNTQIGLSNGQSTAPGQVTSSGATGGYTVSLPAGSYTLTPSRSSADDAISSLDASKVLRHVVALETLTGSAATAADVNSSGSITAQDAFQILQYVAGLSTLPFNGSSTVWRFTPENRSFNSLSSNQINQHFTGILLGDTTGNWVAPSSPDASKTPSLRSSVTSSNSSGRDLSGTHLSLHSSTGLPGSRAETGLHLDVVNGGFLSLDFDITYDPSIAQVVSVTKSALLDEWSVLVNTQTPGLIRIAAAGAEEVTSLGKLFALEFDIVGEETTISDLKVQNLRIDEGQIEADVTNGVIRAADPVYIFRSKFSQPESRE